jgi:DNA-damage-inducible protein J
MSKSAMLRARLEPELKHDAEAIFTRLGLNSTQAITIFYRQVELHQGLPFNVVVPSSTTKRTFDATDEGRDLVVCKDSADMFKKLGI